MRICRNDCEQALLLDGIDLVDDQNGGCAGGCDLRNERLLLRADIGNGVDEQQHNVHVRNGLLDDIDHIVAQTRARLVEARRVNEHKLGVAVDHAVDNIISDMR